MIKWLKEEELKTPFKENVLQERRLPDSVQEWWENSKVILKAGQKVLGMSTGRRPPGDKESWWWNEEVKEAIRAKKEAKRKWATSGRQEKGIAIGRQTRRKRTK